MQFPAPQPTGNRERSIAERHRMLVLLASMFNLLPVGYAVGLVVSHPPLRLLLTLGISFALTYTLVQLLRRRFLTLALTSELILRRTHRNPTRRATDAAHALTTRGFAPVDTVVVATKNGEVLTRPIVVMARHADALVASANSMGVGVISGLSDGTWLITSSADVVAHPELRVRRVGTRDVSAAVATHTEVLRDLASQAVFVQQIDPLDAVLHIEHLEQNTLAAFRASGISSPSAKALTAPAGS